MNRKQSVVLSVVVVLLILSSIGMGLAEDDERSGVFYVLVLPVLLAGGLLLFLLRDKNHTTERDSARPRGTDKAIVVLVALTAAMSGASWSAAKQAADNEDNVDLSPVEIGIASLDSQLDELQSELERIRRTIAFGDRLQYQRRSIA